MAQRITAVYQTEGSVSAAEEALRSAGFSVGRERVVGQTSGAATTELPEPAPAKFDESWILAVHSPFGTARRIIAILKANGATAVREEVSQPGFTSSRSDFSIRDHAAGSLSQDVSQPDESFFFSSILGLPLLTRNPAPLSSLLGLPTLIHND